MYFKSNKKETKTISKIKSKSNINCTLNKEYGAVKSPKKLPIQNWPKCTKND